jgi:alpha/beta superfamily hydrolase
MTTPHHDSRNFFLEGPVGRLEAILWTPRSDTPPPLAALVCHPHPLFGGTMHNKVVFQAAKSIDALGIPVLRFNFRGAGLSAGVHDRGMGEREDVRTALQFLLGEFPGVPLLVAGFSFGSAVGLRVGCKTPEVTHLIAMGLPVNNADVSFLSECPKPKLFVHGSNDGHGAITKIEELVPTLPGENRLVIVEDVDHFFAGKLSRLGQAITSWLTDQLPILRT